MSLYEQFKTAIYIFLKREGRQQIASIADAVEDGDITLPDEVFRALCPRGVSQEVCWYFLRRALVEMESNGRLHKAGKRRVYYSPA